MGYAYDLMEPLVPRCFCRSVPGPVRRLQATSFPSGILFLQWEKPAGSAATSFRVERTREGRNYVLLFETDEPRCSIKNVPLHEPWFYRVTAVNSRGAGKAKQVWFFQHEGNRASRLLRVPVVPGLRVGICELGGL